MRNTVGIILAGDETSGYGVLTLNRAKSAIPFAANYRLIDFVLSDLSNSGVRKVGVIIQYLPASLIEYIGVGRAWEFVGVDRIVKIMPPFVGTGRTEWYKGTANAVYQNLSFINQWDATDVIVLGGDRIYHIDFADLLKHHREKNADMTIAVEEATRVNDYDCFAVDVDESESTITSFYRRGEDRTECLCSVGIAIFNKDVLARHLQECERRRNTYSMSGEVISRIVDEKNSAIYRLKSYHNPLATVFDYYAANMGLLADSPEIDIEGWDIITNVKDRNQGFRFATYFGDGSEVVRSIVSAGSNIMGRVENSILSPGVVVEAGAVVNDSILMHDCIVGKGALIHKTIADKDVIFSENCRVGEQEESECINPELPHKSPNLTLIGKGVKIPPGFIVKSSSQIYPGIDLATHPYTTVERGTNVKETLM